MDTLYNWIGRSIALKNPSLIQQSRCSVEFCTWAICIRLARLKSLTGTSPVTPYNSGLTIAGQTNCCRKISAQRAFASSLETIPII